MILTSCHGRIGRTDETLTKLATFKFYFYLELRVNLGYLLKFLGGKVLG
jgi:hypothetical protein